MNRLEQFLIATGILVAFSAFAEKRSETGKLPHVVFILADDMGPGEPSHMGGLVPTPALDRMAKEGMRFTDAHTTSSVCTPTRYGILTGRYNWRSRLKRSVLFRPTEKALMDPERVNLPTFLQRKGYHTGMVGKWHLGADWELLEKRPEGPDRKDDSWRIDYSKPFRNGPWMWALMKRFSSCLRWIWLPISI